MTAWLWQFSCGRCGRYFTPRHGALAERAQATERFLDCLAEWATHGDVSAAARFRGVLETTAERWCYDHMEQRQREPVGSLGIDELSLKHRTARSAAS